MTDMCKSWIWWICYKHSNKHAKCWILSVCAFSSMFMFILFILPLHLFIAFGGNLKSGQIGTISPWLYFTPFNGNIVYSLDCSSSQIHALKILHAWAHPIRMNLSIHMGPRPLLGRLRRKSEPTLLDCSWTKIRSWYWGGLPLAEISVLVSKFLIN